MTPAQVQVQIGDESVDAVMAVPASGSGPAVLVIQEWWGLVPHIQTVVQRLADDGFVALAVDHYRGRQTSEPDEAGKLMLGLRIEQVADDLAAAATWLLTRPEVTGDTACVVGFCMGGGLALLAPTVSPVIRAAAAFYPATPWPDYAPNWSAYRGRFAVVHKAAEDEGHMGAVIDDIAQQIRAADGQIEVYAYPGTHHAFFNDDRPEVCDESAAALAWNRTLDFFRAHTR